MTVRARIAKEKVAGSLMFVLTLASLLLVVVMGVGLYLKSSPILKNIPCGSYCRQVSGSHLRISSVFSRFLWVRYG